MVFYPSNKIGASTVGPDSWVPAKGHVGALSASVVHYKAAWASH